VVESSNDARYSKGDSVLVTGCALSETHDAVFRKYARVKGTGSFPCAGLDEFTACPWLRRRVHRGARDLPMEHNGQTPSGGPIAVTGASGGVGSIAIDMLAGGDISGCGERQA